VATIKTTSGYGIFIGKITAKYCLCIECGDGGYKYYKYTYATKTKKKISEKTFTKLGGDRYM
jgi:hypothetical protein